MTPEDVSREGRISTLRAMLAAAKTKAEQHTIFRAIKKEIAERSPEAVAALEVERHLIREVTG